MAEHWMKIVSKDKSTISIHFEGKGQIWASNDNEKSFFSCGSVQNGACNVHKVLGIPKIYDDYFPVSVKILRFAKKFKIKQLRLILHKAQLVKYGWKTSESYGYITRSKFERLLRKRKQIEVHDHKIILLKKSDAEWRDE